LGQASSRLSPATKVAGDPMGEPGPIRLSVIIAVYSETDSLVETIRRVEAADEGFLHEIILTISPRSSEECLQLCERLDAENPRLRSHIQQRTPGVGWAQREAMELATGTHVIGLLSADLETEPEAIPRMVRKLRETGCDAVTGNRWLPGGGFVGYDRLKLVLNWIFQKSFSLLYSTRIGDLSYGYKLLSKEICESIEWEGTLHEIFIETTVKPLKAGYHFEQVPTVWTARSVGTSKNTFWRNFRYVSMALRVWWRG